MKKKIKMWEKDIEMYLILNTAKINRFNQLISKSNDIMLNRAEKEFNPLKHPLSDEARKRLKWLSIIHSNWIESGNDLRHLEPQSRVPRNNEWEYVYNNIRPHQALGNLTTMSFYKLWKKNSEKAYQIAEKWKKYLKEQSERLANSRKIKSKEKIAKLMVQIDRKLANSYT